MKLYHYDHCPYCVRVRMILGLRDVDVVQHILLSDDEVTPIDLIGVKQLPILQKQDGTHMGESLDIVRYIDEYAGKERLNEAIRPEIQTWFDKVNAYIGRLTMPRNIKLGLPEFATQNAMDYFIQKKEKNIGSFVENWDKTDEYLREIHRDLQELNALIESPHFLNGQDESLEDILIFPLLRNLSMVKGLVYPDKILVYLDNMGKRSKVNLYFDIAV